MGTCLIYSICASITSDDPHTSPVPSQHAISHPEITYLTPDRLSISDLINAPFFGSSLATNLRHTVEGYHLVMDPMRTGSLFKTAHAER
jgi:hypothetical protein